MSGRPKTGFVTKLKTIIWYEQVAERVLKENIQNNVRPHQTELDSRSASKNKLDKFFNENGSKIWTKFSTGQVSPVTKLKIVENKLPNTIIYFIHPIWEILSKTYVTEEDLYNFYKNLNSFTQKTIQTKNIKDVVINFDANFAKEFDCVLDLYSFLLFKTYQSKFKLHIQNLEYSYLALMEYSLLIINLIGCSGYYLIKLLQLHFQLEPNSRLIEMGADIDFHLKQINQYHILKIAHDNNPQRYTVLKNHFDDFKNEFHKYQLKLTSIENLYTKNSEEL
ncbi:hypothetical protein [Acinetobacter towneri]|uniref:hypothetical protein n=1 Tax=Acinetobacter towneri TaxID=202956 RepID=UPI0020979CB2|nr:hypothetical protein [Acinetobacter towneri]MCO8047070.1 hypothetical protein [Acinetobacter towneri]